MPIVLVFGSERHVIEDGRPVVLPKRATIESKDGSVTIRDDAGDGKTVVGGVPVAKGRARVVRPGDKVRLGDVDGLFESTDTGPVLDTRQIAMAMVKEVDRAGAAIHPRVRVVEGSDVGAQLDLVIEAHAYRVGRSSNCELPLSDDKMSREHVRITRKGLRVFVRDLDSARGTFIGESRIEPQRDAAWDPSLMLRAGETVLALHRPIEAVLVAAQEKILVAAEQPKKEVAPASEPVPSAPKDAPGGAAPIVAAPMTVDKQHAPKPPPLERIILIVGLAFIALCLAGLGWLFKDCLP